MNGVSTRSSDRCFLEQIRITGLFSLECPYRSTSATTTTTSTSSLPVPEKEEEEEEREEGGSQENIELSMCQLNRTALGMLETIITACSHQLKQIYLIGKNDTMMLRI